VLLLTLSISFAYPNTSGRFSAQKNSAANSASRILFGTFLVNKNSAANLAIHAGLESTSIYNYLFSRHLLTGKNNKKMFFRCSQAFTLSRLQGPWQNQFCLGRYQSQMSLINLGFALQ